MNSQIFEQTIWINAPVDVVDRVITNQHYMRQWLNPMLRCDPIGEWSTEIGAKSLFVIQVPILKPTLRSEVVERSLGLVVWSFDGFFKGCDRWACSAQDNGTRLCNQFTFKAASPWVEKGFQLFAASLTKRDMEQQLRRLKTIAERINAPNIP